MKNSKFLTLAFLFILTAPLFSVQAFGQTWLDATIRGSLGNKETNDRRKRTLEINVKSAPYDVDLLPQTKFILVAPEFGPSRFIMTIRDGMDLRSANLTKQKFTNVEIKDSDFSRANFYGADFRQAVFVRCNFSEVRLTDVQTDDYTKFVDCNFEGAFLSGSLIKGIPPEQVKQVRMAKSRDAFGTAPDYFPADYFSDVAGEPRDFNDEVVTGAFENLTGKELARSLSAKRKDYSNVCVYANNAKTRLNQESEYLDFTDYDFSDSFLYNCGFSGVDFTGASFENAVLNKVSFSHCVISFEQIKSTWNYRNNQLDSVLLPGDIQGQLDREVFYKSKSFNQKELLDEEFEESRLITRKQRRGAELCEDLNDDEFLKRMGIDRGKKRIFYYKNIDGWDLSGMNLKDSYIGAVSAQGTDFTDAEIEGAFFQGGVQYMNGNSDGKIGKAQLESTASYKRKRLRGVKFSSIFNLRDVDFSHCDLTNSIFLCDLYGVDLTDAVITGCEMRGASVQQIKSTWNYKTGHMQGIVLSPEVHNQFFHDKRAYDE